MSGPLLLALAGSFLILGMFGIAPGVFASEADHLAAMLEEFLATSHRRAAHERFWAEDLVYASSSGSRFGKAEILEGFAVSDAYGYVPEA